MTETKTAILIFAENRESFRFSELLSYLNNMFEISKVTLSWYLKKMVEESLLYKLGRGIYTSMRICSTEYVPRLGKTAVTVFRKLSAQFRFIGISVFDGDVLADFQHHVSANHITYVEVDRDAMESVFHFLKKEGYRTFLNPDKNFVYDNIDLSVKAIIVKPLITESPLITYNGIRTPSLEKILVDVLCDDDMDYLHGAEWSRMFENAMSRYAINRTAILRYASRRNAKDRITTAIKKLNSYD